MENFEELEDLILSVPLSPMQQYVPHQPTLPQAAFLRLPHKEALYGGAAGGGKSDALLMAALEFVNVPNYSAILFRKTFQDLSLPDALIPRSHEWLSGTDARYDSQQHEWRFPSGAKLAFGYMDTPADMYRYQGAAFQFIGWDELTQFTEEQYLYMFSRLRSTVGLNVPLRVRAASNPGGVGHRWVKRRFIDLETKDPEAVYVPARLEDNPFLRGDYADSLKYLDAVTKARYLDGDWAVVDENIFVFSDFDRVKYVKTPPSMDVNYYRRTIAGVDPGTSDPYAVVILAQDVKGVWWQVEEFYRTGGSTSKWLATFQDMQRRWRCKAWYVDKRKPSDMIDLVQGDLPAMPNHEFHNETGKGTIRPMLNVVQKVMREKRFFISPRCVHTIDECEAYRYPNPEAKNAGEVPVDADNHTPDAFRYAICSVESITGDLDPRYRSAKPVKPYGWKAKPLKEQIPSIHEQMRAFDEREDGKSGASWQPMR